MLLPGKSPIYPCSVQKSGSYLTLAALALLLVAPARPSFAAAAARKHRTTSISATHSSKGKQTSRHATKKPLGPRGIDDNRAAQIQTALIKAGYLTGEPSGHWDAASQSAMVKLQSDNGWQTKLVPDSRALIKLGLGPGNGPNATSLSHSTTTASNSTPFN